MFYFIFLFIFDIKQIMIKMRKKNVVVFFFINYRLKDKKLICISKIDDKTKNSIA